MKTWLALLTLLALVCPAARADVAAVAVRVEQRQAWIGQRVPFYVELRARGPFAGSPRFELPQLPGSVLIKIGSPVVGSLEAEGESWTVQTHEFALFAQTPGRFEMPEFAVHFASREGFAGPVVEKQAQVPGWSIEIRRPPGSEAIGFLITTPALEISETWEPLPAATQAGAVFKRTIVQRASSVSGIALAPASVAVPEGVRVYRGSAKVEDHLERGEFTGERRETLTYLLPRAGSFTLPALGYTWWNPDTRTLESTMLEAVTVDVAPAPAAGPGGGRAWAWLLITILSAGAGYRWRHAIARWCGQLQRFVNTPQRVAARRLLHACRHDDANAAGAAWIRWRNAQDSARLPDEELRVAVAELDRHLYAQRPPQPWCGDRLAGAFAAHQAAVRASSRVSAAAALGTLNP
ncbi:MAG: BatD family protein [Gammaproteobacteria bacterium]|jgi:hypothetical protein|nr:BatD family protein [Gammaproteobacteria bacterium]MBP6052928.1 BatD family protein [Pseudomonadales bacterium]MBK6581956.1 BatD family protein [Gammaproteobacteria bacterium]MBK7170370.1 BatD family protein [Gammaproteobacteria bacterium]MBK7521781.1 BatD family protein [Gammaproteobacteria bacterium]